MPTTYFQLDWKLPFQLEYLVSLRKRFVMTNNYYNQIPLSDLQTLKKLKSTIEEKFANSDDYQPWLNDYTEEIDDLLPLLDNPLKPEYELAESLLPKSYLEFKESCLSSPPYTFKYHCQQKDAIALVKITSVNSTNTKVHGKLLKVFTGDSGWFKKNWWGKICIENASRLFPVFFEINETALVFLNHINDRLVIFGRNDKLTIDLNENRAISLDRDTQEYWNGFKHSCKNDTLILDWQEIKEFLSNIEQKSYIKTLYSQLMQPTRVDINTIGNTDRSIR